MTDDQRSGADAAIRYLTGNAAFLRYDRALAAGWPIATGLKGPAARTGLRATPPTGPAFAAW
jgi:hypothetical protein